jgi:NADH dehydrogenase
VARPRVVIVGAGFGGLQCARKLESSAVDVLLVDRHNYHLFTPLLYQVASALLNPSDIAFPVRKVFRGSSNVRFRQAEVVRADFARRQLELAEGEPIAYDRLVIAAGSTTHFYGNRALQAQAHGLKSLGQALELRNHVLGCLEAASRESAAERQLRRLTFVVVGGGPTGVEFAGALAELMRLVVDKEYPQIRVRPRIVLVEGSEQLLGMFERRLGEYAAARLGRLGVEVRTGVLVDTLDGAEVKLSDGGLIEADTLVWSAGVKAAELSIACDAPLTRSGRVAVDGFLRLDGEPQVYAIGDIAGVVHQGSELPMISPPAMQQGRYVADHILAHLADTPDDPPKLAPFEYLDKGAMATIGRNAAVCSLRGTSVTGFVGWMAWLVVHIYYLIGFRNRLVVLWSWCWNYLWYDRPVRIITRARAAPALNPSASAERAPNSG